MSKKHSHFLIIILFFYLPLTSVVQANNCNNIEKILSIHSMQRKISKASTTTTLVTILREYDYIIRKEFVAYKKDSQKLKEQLINREYINAIKNKIEQNEEITNDPQVYFLLGEALYRLVDKGNEFTIFSALNKSLSLSVEKISLKELQGEKTTVKEYLKVFYITVKQLKNNLKKIKSSRQQKELMKETKKQMLSSLKIGETLKTELNKKKDSFTKFESIIYSELHIQRQLAIIDYLFYFAKNNKERKDILIKIDLAEEQFVNRKYDLINEKNNDIRFYNLIITKLKLLIEFKQFDKSKRVRNELVDEYQNLTQKQKIELDILTELIVK